MDEIVIQKLNLDLKTYRLYSLCTVVVQEAAYIRVQATTLSAPSSALQDGYIDIPI